MISTERWRVRKWLSHTNRCDIKLNVQHNMQPEQYQQLIMYQSYTSYHRRCYVHFYTTVIYQSSSRNNDNIPHRWEINHTSALLGTKCEQKDFYALTEIDAGRRAIFSYLCSFALAYLSRYIMYIADKKFWCLRHSMEALGAVSFCSPWRRPRLLPRLEQFLARGNVKLRAVLFSRHETSY